MPARVIPTRRRLRAGLAQLVFVATGVGLGLAVPSIGRGPQVPAHAVINMLFSVGLGVLGVVAVIFSLLFLVVQWVATTFTPRLTLFRDAPIVWRTSGYAVGVALFCFTAALVIGTDSKVSMAVPIIAVVLTLGLLALLRTLHMRAFSAIQLAPALSAIAARGRAILAVAYPQDAGPAAVTAAPRATVTWPHPPATLQSVRMERLLETARSANAVVVLRSAPGATLHHGSAVADVYGAELPDTAVLEALIVGNERTFDQDPLLAFRLLADIALRALSPAVHDPATAVQAMDELGDLLGWVAAARLGPLPLTDRDGAERLVVQLPHWEDFVRTGLDDIAVAAVGSPMALTHLREMLERVRDRARPDRAASLTQRLTWVNEQLTHRFPYLR
ncbi:DUF2254 family protein [Nocardia amikacinitolerans]|uniref:DUF2254 family protein n=1 Tax=Nocardia amikacinitolerans TaxID=756689 RepID=UPI0020A580F6|nr:DUF2254 family protein [Nocardia amikacinitolerans]MCP2280514.1 putative membrane protein [Nocardia amikacinitolerans]